MIRIKLGIVISVFLCGAVRTCSKNGSFLRTEAQVSSTESKILSKSAEGIKGAADDLHYLSATEKQIISKHNSNLKSIEGSTVLKEEKLTWDEFISENLRDELIMNLVEWGFEKEDPGKVITMAAKSVAYSEKGDIICKMIQQKKKLSYKLSRDNLFQLLVGNKIGDLEITKNRRVDILYRFSDNFAAWILARLIDRSKCDPIKMNDIRKIINDRKVQNDERLVKALNSCH
jgi:hypothetical protein